MHLPFKFLLFVVAMALCLSASNQQVSELRPRIKHQEKTNKPKEKAAQLPDPQKPPSATVSSLESQPIAQNKPYGKTENRTNLQIIHDYLKSAFTANNLSNWVLAGIGLVGVLFAQRTLKALHRQSKSSEIASHAAKKSADAAWLNAEAVIKAERAYIVINKKTSTIGTHEFFGVNKGRTPAEIISVFSDFTYPTTEKDKLVVFFGRICYRDLVGTSRESKFCFVWDGKEKSLRTCGPKGANENT